MIIGFWRGSECSITTRAHHFPDMIFVQVLYKALDSTELVSLLEACPSSFCVVAVVRASEGFAGIWYRRIGSGAMVNFYPLAFTRVRLFASRVTNQSALNEQLQHQVCKVLQVQSRKSNGV